MVGATVSHYRVLSTLGRGGRRMEFEIKETLAWFDHYLGPVRVQ